MMQKRNIAMTTFSGSLRTSLITAAWVIALAVSAAPVFAQTEEVAVMQQVAELIDQLNSASVNDRDAAQQKLIAMEPEALDFIDVPKSNATTDFIQRLLAIRKQLESKAIQQTTQPSTVTLSGTFNTQTALAKIASQTKNKISLSDRISPATPKRSVTLNLQSVPFWDAVNSVMRQSDLEIDLYGGSIGEIVLVDRPPSQNKPADAPPQNDQPQPATDRAPATVPQTTSGILAIAVNRVNASRIFNAPNLNYTTLNLLIRWEPRVSPISIQLDPSNLKIVDEQEKTIQPLRQTPISATVQPEIPEINFPVNLPLIDRSINQIKSVSGTLDAVLPGRTETFRFRNLGAADAPATQTKSGATVTVGEVNINEELFGVTVGLAFEGESNELDSHQGWTFDNEAYLIDPADPNQRHESVAYETVSQNGQSVVVEYYFEVDPAKYDLVYQTPAAIVSVSFDFELKDIPLP